MQEQLDSSKYLKQHIDNMADSATSHRKINNIIGTRPHFYLFISSIESDAKGNIEQVLAEVYSRDIC